MSLSNPLPLEKTFQNYVIRQLKKLSGCWFFKSNELSLRGIPDIIACINGTFIALELKRSAKARVTKLQLYNLNLLTSAGGYAKVAYPENWEQIYKELKAL